MMVFFGLVIKDTSLSVAQKQTLIDAILDHYAEGTKHQFCPIGPKSWCKAQRDIATPDQPPTHRATAKPLAKAIVEVGIIKQVNEILIFISSMGIGIFIMKNIFSAIEASG